METGATVAVPQVTRLVLGAMVMEESGVGVC